MCQGNELELMETYAHMGAVVVENSDRTGNSKGEDRAWQVKVKQRVPSLLVWTLLYMDVRHGSGQEKNSKI